MKRLLVLTALLLTLSTVTAQPVRTFGFIGDSNTDEYRADDGRGGVYASTTLNWLEQLVRYRGVNAGAWGSYSEPRRSGYAYNWSRSGAVSCDIPAQASGLASQSVTDAIIYVGTNDFHTWNSTYSQVYSGALSDAQVAAKVSSIVGCITSAVNTLQAAGNPRIVLANIGDPGTSASFIAQFPSASGRQRVTNAIQAVNTQLAALASARGLTIVNIYGLPVTLAPRFNANGTISVGGELIDAINRGDEPHHMQLGDSVGHLGTVVNGLLANVFIDAMGGITPFTDAEILQAAGIGAQATATPTPQPTIQPTAQPTSTAAATNTPSPTATPTPTPLPTLNAKTVVRRSLTSGRYFVFDGIVENGIFTEVTSGRFAYAGSWMVFGSMGRNNSPSRVAYGAGRTVTFTTSASTLVVQSYRSAQNGSFSATVNGVAQTFNMSGAAAFVDVPIPLN